MRASMRALLLVLCIHPQPAHTVHIVHDGPRPAATAAEPPPDPRPSPPPNPVPLPNTVFTFGAFRVTVITSRLLRIEETATASTPAFDDRATLRVLNRRGLAAPAVTVTANTSSTLAFTTAHLTVTLTADGGGPKVAFGDTVWTRGKRDPLNLLGTYAQGGLDCYSSPAKCNTGEDLVHDARLVPGLLSRSGWAVLDDTATARLTNASLDGWLSPRTHKVDRSDVYLFAGYNTTEYAAWLGDAVLVFGRPRLPPLSAFGIWWSDETAYSAATFTSEVLDGFARYDLPLHVAVLDDGWHTMNHELLCFPAAGFTWNETLFPSPSGFVDLLHNASANPLRRSLPLLVNLHLQYPVTRCEQNWEAFLSAAGEPADAPFVLTDLSSRRFTDALFSTLVDPIGADAYWTDSALYAAGTGVEDPALWQNIVFARRQLMAGRRPLILSRYGPRGLGNHRAGAMFTGDAFQTWDTLAYEVYSTPIHANALMGYLSHDIGGFHAYNGSGDGNASNPADSELYLRWVQFGALAPIMRTHCSYCERRIWKFIDFGPMAQAFRLRDALVPLTYTLAQQATRTGVSIVRPTYYASDEPGAYAARQQYLFGPDVLAAPISSPAVGPRREVNVTVFLPHAVDGWCDWEATARFAGSVTRAYGLASIPLFVRRGAVLPLRRAVSRSAAWQPQLSDTVAASLLWTVFPAGARITSSGVLIEDDGSSLSADTAESRAEVAHGTAATVAVLSAVRGSYAGMATARSVSLAFRGVSSLPRSVTVGAARLPSLPSPPSALGQRGYALLASQQAAEAVPEGPLVLPRATLLVALGSVRASEEVKVTVFW